MVTLKVKFFLCESFQYFRNSGKSKQPKNKLKYIFKFFLQTLTLLTQFQIIGRDKRGSRGVWKLFLVKSGNPLSLITYHVFALSSVCHFCISYVCFILFPRKMRVYILGLDGIKTDNWLKLFELNCLQFRK